MEPLANYLVRLTFSDGMSKEVDLQPYIGKGIAAALKDETYFRKVTLEEGVALPGPTVMIFAPISCMKKSLPLI
ncbi:MAG: DUF2442 domain-containing protein [Chloroflexi bacterium]|nr:DUF2442 domain-containing protein [Chloroflexota bacterium]